jgi:hypothetical protein
VCRFDKDNNAPGKVKGVEIDKVREKLVALLTDGNNPAWKWFPNNAAISAMADFLVDNGATFVEESAAFGKWIPVTEELPIFTPGRRRSVLVTLEDHDGKRLVTTAKYNEEFDEWVEFKDYRYMDFKVLAWMPKPYRYGGA